MSARAGAAVSSRSMSTTPKHTDAARNGGNFNQRDTEHSDEPKSMASSNYDASRIFRFETYALKLRERAAASARLN